MLKPGSQELFLRYSRVTKVLHYPVSVFLGAVYSSEVALEFAKAKGCLQLCCFCSEWHWAGNYTVWIWKIFLFQVMWMLLRWWWFFFFYFYKEIGVLPSSIWKSLLSHPVLFAIDMVQSPVINRSPAVEDSSSNVLSADKSVSRKCPRESETKTDHQGSTKTSCFI